MGILDQIFKPKAERDYDRAMRDRKFDRAIQIAQEHGLDSPRIVDAAKAWMDREWEAQHYERAAQIGTQFRLSKRRTAEAADRALEAALKSKDLGKAVAIVEQFELDKRKLMVECDRLYQHEMEAESYKAAADIARRAGLDRERIEKAVSRAFKKALRDKDDEGIAELGRTYPDFDLDWDKVRQSIINIMAGHLVGQVYDKALDIAKEYKLLATDAERAVDQAAASRHRYLESLRGRLVTKEGQALRAQSVEEIHEELATGYRREREKRGE